MRDEDKSIKLATGVTHPHLRHPAVTASALASLDELTGGRIILGIGTGDSALHTLGKQPRPLSEVKETVRVFRALTRGEEVEYEGARIRIPWSQHRIPVYVAATGPKSLELAGEIADGIVTQHGCYPPVNQLGLDHIKKGAERADANSRTS